MTVRLSPSGDDVAVQDRIRRAGLRPLVSRRPGERYAAAPVLRNVLFVVPTSFAALTHRESAMRAAFVTSIACRLLPRAAMAWDRA
ncbi:MAG: hypothetical protein KF830_12885 [Planctomycetes bacterium]|nr:hypothetical protein [Planctomycetota bacterium]